MKKLSLFFKKAFPIICMVSLAFSATGCGCIAVKNATISSVVTTQTTVAVISPSFIAPDDYMTDTFINATPPAGVELPTLKASNLSIPAGSSIDYLGNLVIEGEGDTEITEIYVNTSNVRPNVPGIYNVTYTVNFRGYPVSKTIVVTITSPKEDSGIPTYSSTVPGTPISDMTITLLSGMQCHIPCTTEHYILESSTEEKREEILGKTYLTSVLKIVFNDGEIVELETVRSRVSDAE